ncbi:MAG: nucleotidyltransferase domain-containing protein [Syntrophomonas sp.]|nr:nucleotidyltransferase domain-containing protein [Syntrophomonas sp.]
MSSNERESIRKLLLKTDPKTIKHLFNLDQSFNADEVEQILDGKEKEFRPFIKIFPELQLLYEALHNRSIYLKENPSVLINWLSYGKKGKSLTECNKLIKKAHQEFRKRITQAKLIAQESGLILFDQGTPNQSSPHYQVACQAAGLLCSKWFIDKVYLFGSVSRGEERPNSDIDIAISMVTKRNPSPINSLIKKCLQSVHEQYHEVIPEAICNETRTMFDVVTYNKKLLDSGHLKDAILIAENNMFEAKIGKKSFTFEKTSLISEYSYVETWHSGIMQSLVYRLDGDIYQNVLIKDDIPVLYRIISFQVDEVGYIRPQTLDNTCIRKYGAADGLNDADNLVFQALRPMQPKQTYWMDDNDE